MKTQLYSLIALVVIVIAIVAVTAIAAVMAWYNKPVEALGLTAVTTGLIGVLGTFRPRHHQEDVPPVDEVAP